MELAAAGPMAGAMIVGIDPHKHAISACIIDSRGGVTSNRHFKNSEESHEQMLAWAHSHGPVVRWGIENATSYGRPTTEFLCERSQDVRDVCPNRTSERARRRRQGKSDVLDAERIARETLADPKLPIAFKRNAGDSGPHEVHELISLWHKEKRSIVKQRQQLLNESETLLSELPERLRVALPATSAVRPRLRALVELDDPDGDPATVLRIQLLEEHWQTICDLDRRQRLATKNLKSLLSRLGSTLNELCGIDTATAAELIVEVGDARRFTEAGFGRFNGTAPLPASSGEAGGPPKRHRFNRGGNRRVNSVLHIMALTQLRCEPRARAIYEASRLRGHTKKEAMRVLKRQLSNVVYRKMIRDLNALREVEVPAA